MHACITQTHVHVQFIPIHTCKCIHTYRPHSSDSSLHPPTPPRHEEDSPKISGNVSDTSSQEDNLFVELKREPSGFGFGIRGGAEYGARLCVLNIAPGGAAEKDGKLRVSGRV